MTRRLLFYWSSLAALCIASPAWSQTWPDHGWMWHSHWGWGGGLGMILFWVAIVLLVVFALRGFRRAGSHSVAQAQAPGEKTPLQILQERFARGEIDKSEYEERRKVLAG